MKIFWASIIFIGLIALLSNCTDRNANSNIKTILHPNNDSELTLLMRDMYNYFDTLKVNIQNGDFPEQIRDFKEIHNAVSTEPSKSKSALYKAMSTVYLESARRLNSTNNNMPEVFNHMVDNCMNCHRQMCPGPMVKIKKLYMNVAN